MSIERAELLKRELTDKWVVVTPGAPELHRFASLTGKVKTVNMNCRALVEFNGSVDISWYDIDPSFLKVVDAPQPKPAAAAPAQKKQPAAAQSASTPPAAASAAAGGGSPLDKIRAQGAGDAAAKPAASPAAGGSPMDQIRAQAAAGAAASPPSAQPADPAPAAEPEAKPVAQAQSAPTPPPAGGSLLDHIRSQGPAKG